MSEHFEFKFNCDHTVLPANLNFFCFPSKATSKQLHEEYVSGAISGYILKQFKKLPDRSIEIPAQEDCRYDGEDHPELSIVQINLTKVWDIQIDGKKYPTELDYLKWCLISGEDSPITEPMKQLFLNIKPRVDIERKVFEESVFSWVDAAVSSNINISDMVQRLNLIEKQS